MPRSLILIFNKMEEVKVSCTTTCGKVLKGILFPFTGTIRVLIYIGGLPFHTWKRKSDFSTVISRKDGIQY